jgi:hypothetical protein
MDGDPADALLVDDQGDVGIGLTNPQARLDVEDSSSANGTIAIRGTASSTGNGNGIAGVVGETRSTADFNAGAGVMGFAASPTGGSAGVMGAASGDHGAGVYGVAHHVSGQTYGVYGECVSPNGWAGYFAGARSYFSGKVGIGWAASVQPKLYVRENSDLLYATAIAGEASSVTAHNSRGVVGTTYCTDAVQTGAGVMGIALGSVSKSSGVLGVAAGGSGRAIEGIAEHETGENIAIHGVTHSTTGFSCYMEGPRNYFSGRVGIGTTTPQARLHVHEAAGLSSAIEMTNVSTGNGVSDGLQLGLAADGTGKLTNFEDKALSLGTDRIARMTIQPDGKISIGGSDTLGTVTITDANPSLALNSTDGGSHPGAGISFCHQGENQGFIGWSGWDDQLVIGNGAVYVELGSQRLGVGTGAWSPKDLLDVTGAGGTWGGVNGYTEVVGHFTNDGSGHTAVSIDALERDIENLRAASGGAR